MAEIILRGKTGSPVVRSEGTAVIVKKTIAGATIEERTAGTRITGKQSTTTMHTTAELQAAFKSIDVAVAAAIAQADEKS